MFILKRDCVNCGRKSLYNRICLEDPKKRPVEIKTGFRPDWCPIDDNQFKKENWEKKTA